MIDRYTPFLGSLLLLALACSAEDATTAGADGAGSFLVTVSGEDLALLGYDFGPDARADGDPPAFVDGWALTFDHVIVTVDALRINAEPDRDEGNPFDVGALVASADEPGC